MLGQIVLIAIIFVLILILCFRRKPNSSNDPDIEVDNNGAGNSAAATIPQQLSSTQLGKRNELAAASLFRRDLKEGDDVLEIQSILAAARDSALSNHSEGPNDGAESELEQPTHSIAIEIESESRTSDRSIKAESDHSLVASIRSFTGALIDKVVPGQPECTICLDGYEAGQSISWSKYGECDHIFHTSCIEQWLSKHNDCPLCRLSIISSSAAHQATAATAEP